MGYRSTIVIYIKENKDINLEDIVNLSEIIEEMGRDCYELGINSNNEKVLRVTFSDIKWYSTYDIVKFWNNVLNKIDEDDFLFTRTGEDYKDCEIYGEYGYAYPVCEIDYDVDFTY